MKLDKRDLLLYAVTDRHWLNGRTLLEVVRESLDGGVTMLQLREKTLEEGAFLEEARALQALCRERHVPFIVNDNVDHCKGHGRRWRPCGPERYGGAGRPGQAGAGPRSSAFPPTR